MDGLKPTLAIEDELAAADPLGELTAIIAEEDYFRAERVGIALDSLLCAECPCIADCQAEGECVRGDDPC